MSRLCAAMTLLAVAACSLLATAQGREVTDVPFNFTQAQASAAVNAVVQRPELVTNWLKQVKLPNYMQLQKWVSAFPPAGAAVPPPQQAPPQQQGPPNQQQGPPNQQQGPPNQQQPAVQSFAAQQPGQPQDAQPQPAQAEQGPPQPQAQPQAQAEQARTRLKSNWHLGPPQPQQGPPRDAGPQGPPGTVPEAAAATSAQP